MHFDNVGSAILGLVQIGTCTNWIEPFNAALDATGVGLIPVPMNSKVLPPIFFSTFIVIGGFFVLEIFTGVIIENYTRCKEEATATGQSGLITESQQLWVDSMTMMLDALPPLPPLPPVTGAAWRKHLFTLVQHPRFEAFILGNIILNVLLLSTLHYGQPAWKDEFDDVAGYVFTAIFTIEAVLKLVALNPIQYCADYFNIFDFLVVVVSLVGSIGDFKGSSAGILRLVRVILKLVRALRSINFAHQMRDLLAVLIRSLPSLINIGCVLFLLFFVYAVRTHVNSTCKCIQ